jgi:hypothetical protein
MSMLAGPSYRLAEWIEFSEWTAAGLDPRRGSAFQSLGTGWVGRARGAASRLVESIEAVRRSREEGSQVEGSVSLDWSLAQRRLGVTLGPGQAAASQPLKAFVRDHGRHATSYPTRSRHENGMVILCLGYVRLQRAGTRMVLVFRACAFREDCSRPSRRSGTQRTFLRQNSR